MAELVKKKLLLETPNNEWSILAEEKEPLPPGTMMLKGIMQKCNTLNANGRVYPRSILEREVDDYLKGPVKNCDAWGELEHRAEAGIIMERVSHRVVNLWWEGDTLMGKVLVMDTPMGSIIQKMVKSGGRPGISSRAIGSLEERNGQNIVQDDLKLVCWDFVAEPSTSEAYMFLSEAKEILVDMNLIGKVTRPTNVDNVIVDRALNASIDMSPLTQRIESCLKTYKTTPAR